MAVTEENRHRLYQRLEAVLGAQEATTLMELVPPVGWADVATKRDLDALGRRIDERFDAAQRQLDLRFAAQEQNFLATLHDQLRMQLIAIIGIVVSGAAATAGLSQLL